MKITAEFCSRGADRYAAIYYSFISYVPFVSQELKCVVERFAMFLAKSSKIGLTDLCLCFHTTESTVKLKSISVKEKLHFLRQERYLKINNCTVRILSAYKLRLTKTVDKILP